MSFLAFMVGLVVLAVLVMAAGDMFGDMFKDSTFSYAFIGLGLFVVVAGGLWGLCEFDGSSADVSSLFSQDAQTKESTQAQTPASTERKYLGEHLDGTVTVQSVSCEPNNDKAKSFTYTVIDQDGGRSKYSTLLDDFEVCALEDGKAQRLETLTVTYVDDYEQKTKQITRLYTNLVD